MSSVASTEPSTLPSMPPEMLDKIFKAAIVKSKRICTSSYTEPTLLMTSRSIRNDMRPSFYALNTFEAKGLEELLSFCVRLKKTDISKMGGLYLYTIAMVGGDTSWILEELEYLLDSCDIEVQDVHITLLLTDEVSLSLPRKYSDALWVTRAELEASKSNLLALSEKKLREEPGSRFKVILSEVAPIGQ